MRAGRSVLNTQVVTPSCLFTPDRVYVVTGEKYGEAMKADVPEIPAENFIIEPSARDNSAAAALGLAVIHKRDPQATVAILTADHHIAKQARFRDVLAAAYKVAQDDRIVTLGIAPSYPSTGFGYIHQGADLTNVNGFTCYHSLGFTEKPTLETALEFLASGEYSWNSGMFIWKTSKALDEYERQQPEMYALLDKLKPTIDTPDYNATLNQIWGDMPKKSIDYAIMEGATNMAVIPVEIGWSDVGSWSSLFEVVELDASGNSIRGKATNHIVIDTENTLVFSDKLTVTIGVKDLIVVDTGDALLVCHKDRSQNVKEVVNQLRETDQHQYL